MAKLRLGAACSAPPGSSSMANRFGAAIVSPWWSDGLVPARGSLRAGDFLGCHYRSRRVRVGASDPKRKCATSESYLKLLGRRIFANEKMVNRVGRHQYGIALRQI